MHFSVLTPDTDEPRFTIGAADPAFELFVSTWADDKMAAIQRGDAPLSQAEDVIAARVIIKVAQLWRSERNALPVAAPAYEILPVAPPPAGPAPPADDPPPPPLPAVPPSTAGKAKKAKSVPIPSKLEGAITDEAAKKPLVSKKEPSGQRVKLAK